MNIFNILQERGWNTVPEEFYTYIDMWKSWYKGKVKAFHNYRVYNGNNYIELERYTLGMAKKVCEDWANLLMNERVQITLEGKKEQEYIDQIFEDNNFYVKINELQEMKAAYGTAAYIPRAVGVSADIETGTLGGKADKIVIDYCTADKIYPLSWENGVITECAFAVEKTVPFSDDSKDDKEKFLYIQIHRLDEKKQYVIENLLYAIAAGSDSNILTRVDNTTVKGFENMPEMINTGSTERQFVIDRLNIANNLDYDLPMGIAVFANAIDCLKGIDLVYDSYCNEFILGKRRLMAKVEALKSIDGKPYFDASDTIFYMLPEDGTSGSTIQPIDIGLRINEHNAGLQDMLNMLSARCGFGESHYKFDNGSMATATQVISENSTLFRSIKKHEIILEKALTDLCRILLRMGNTYQGQNLNEDVEISIDFDDSIIEDKAADEQRTYSMYNAGLMSRDEARALLMNEDEKTALDALPGPNQDQVLSLLQYNVITPYEARAQIPAPGRDNRDNLQEGTERAADVMEVKPPLMNPSQVMLMLNAGLLDRAEARALIMNEPLNEAAAKLPDLQALMMGGEPQNEVE